MVLNFEMLQRAQMAKVMRGILLASFTGVALTASGLTAPGAFACAFDMVKPARTQIDWIVEAERLVLARPATGNPFVFDIIQVLAGDNGGPPIDSLVDSVSRRKLAMNPSESILFAYSAENGWQRVAYIDENDWFVLDTALAHRSEWREGFPQSRLDFITALNALDGPTYWNLVIGELDKVPYQQLREMDLRMSTEELRTKLWSKEGYPYQAILALLLGLSGTEEAREEIREHLIRVQDWNWSNNLGAFAAAHIEIEGVAGVRYLDQVFLQAQSQPLDKLEQIVMAMSVHHGLDDLAVRNEIHAAIGRLIANRPDTAAIVARQFSLRADWSQAAHLKPLVDDRKVWSIADMLTISVYLGRAREAALRAAASDG